MHIDRQIAIWAGWIAGPAFGVAMMAAPEYLKIGPVLSGLLFWGGIIVFMATIIGVLVLSLHGNERQRGVFWPILTMALGALTFCGGVAGYFWPAQLKSGAVPQLAEASDQAAAGLHSDDVISLYLNCRIAIIPTASLPTVLKILEIMTDFGDGITIGEQPAGRQKLGWPPDYLNTMGFRCELTNYGEKTVFDLELLLHLTVREAATITLTYPKIRRTIAVIGANRHDMRSRQPDFYRRSQGRGPYRS